VFATVHAAHKVSTDAARLDSDGGLVRRRHAAGTSAVRQRGGAARRREDRLATDARLPLRLETIRLDVVHRRVRLGRVVCHHDPAGTLSQRLPSRRRAAAQRHHITHAGQFSHPGDVFGSLTLATYLLTYSVLAY